MSALIAVSCDRRAEGPARPPSDRVRPPRPEVFIGESVILALRRAGLEPLLLPPEPLDAKALLDALLDRVQAFVITGGSFDIDPRHYGGTAGGRLDRIDEGRTALELEIARRCIELDQPVLGLCGGEQALAVAAGGTLIGDIATDIPGALEHEQPTDPATAWHSVRLLPGPLREAFGTDEIQVNSTHHQAVADPGLLRIAGRAPDGVVEVVDLPGHRFCLGVQWHPELLHDAPFAALARSLR